jgi:hypothetical protein
VTAAGPLPTVAYRLGGGLLVSNEIRIEIELEAVLDPEAGLR